MPENLLNELPRYSPWSGILMGEESVDPKKKTRDEILREYDREKWATLLSSIQSDLAFNLEKANAQFYSKDPALIIQDKELRLSDSYTAFRRYLDLVEEELEGHLPAKGLVELGCGYGAVILEMAKRFRSRIEYFQALELAQNGQHACSSLAKRLGVNVHVGPCDLTASPIAVDVARDALLFTSFSTHYINHFSQSIISQLIALKPKVVVHFEPVYEHYSDDSMLGLLQRSYIRFNDYNRNMLPVLQKAQQDGLIDILKESKQVFGVNPLLPCSIIVWQPMDIL